MDAKSYHDSKSTEWLLNTCSLLIENKWANDKPLLFDGYFFSPQNREEAVLVFFEALVRNKADVRVLTVKNAVLNLKARKTLDSFLSSNHSLRILNLCKITIDDNLGYLPESLFQARTIQELRIECCKIATEGGLALARMLKTSSSLKTLDLTNVDFGNSFHEISIAFASSSCSLLHLELSENTNLYGDNLADLLKNLQCNRKLHSLTIDQSRIGRTNAPDIATFLARNKSVRSLSLCDNYIDAECMRILTQEGLSYNTTLQTFFVSRNPLGDDGAIYLTDLLKSNDSLQSVIMVDCEIWNRGYKYLARGLAQMKGLRQLTADGDELEEQVDEVLTSLETNMSLVNLLSDRMHSLVHTSSQWKEVDFYLRLNRGKRRILIEQTVPVAVWPRALEGLSSEPDALFYMMKHKPDLLLKSNR